MRKTMGGSAPKKGPYRPKMDGGRRRPVISRPRETARASSISPNSQSNGSCTDAILGAAIGGMTGGGSGAVVGGIIGGVRGGLVGGLL